MNGDVIAIVYSYQGIKDKYHLALCCKQFFKLFKTMKHDEIVKLRYYREGLEKVAEVVNNNPNFKFYYETGSQRTKVPGLKILKNIYKLKISYKSDCDDLSFLKDSNIKIICFERCSHITDIKSLNYVESITIADSYTSSDFSKLTKPKLLSFFNIKSKIIKWPKCKNLERLDIVYMDFSRSILQQSLKYLCISLTTITDKDLIKISKLKKLIELDIRETNVEDVSPLRNSPSLRTLDIALCHKVRDVSMLKNLEALNIYDCYGLDSQKVKEQLKNVNVLF